MASFVKWQSVLSNRMIGKSMTPPVLRLASSVVLNLRRGTTSRIERVRLCIAYLTSPTLMERCTSDPVLAVRIGMLLGNSIDGPSCNLFKQNHLREIKSLIRSFCTERETRVIPLACAVSCLSRVCSHVNEVEGVFGRLLRQMEADSVTTWYTERELTIIAVCLSRFALLCHEEYIATYANADLYRKIVDLLQRRYGDRKFIQELRAASFMFYDTDDRIMVVMKSRTAGYRARSLLLGAFSRAYTINQIGRDEKVKSFHQIVTHLCVPEFMEVSHAHLTSVFAYALGSYISEYQRRGQPEAAEVVLKFAKMLWEGTENIGHHDRSYATRLSLLSGVPWIQPSTEELKKAILPLKNAYAYNLIVSLRGLKSVATTANCPREELKEVVEQIVCDNIHLTNPAEIKYVLRQLADPRVPVSTKAVQKVIEHIQGSSTFDADDLSMMARLVNHHAPPEQQTSLLKEIARKFASSEPQLTTSPLSLITIYDIILRNNADSKAFFDKALEYNLNLGKNNQRSVEMPYQISEVTNILHYVPYVMASVRPLLARGKEARLFTNSLIDGLTLLILNRKEFDSVLAFRVLHFAGWIALCGAPGSNIKTAMRPILQHLTKHHVVTGDTLTQYTKAVTQLFKKTTCAQDTRRLLPILNLYCTILVRNQFILQPNTCSFAISALVRRGHLVIEPVNKIHQEAVRVCARVLLSDKASFAASVTTLTNPTWLSELLNVSGKVLDHDTRKELIEIVNELGVENIMDTKCTQSILHSLAIGDFLSLS